MKEIVIKTEVWKDIQGYEGLYQVSNKGRVRSIDRLIIQKSGGNKCRKGQLLKPTVQNGYYKVALAKYNKKTNFRVHRLVADAFIPNPNNWSFINHIDENKSNNNAENLEWCTRQYNNNYGHRNEKISIARQRQERERKEE